ncbi:MAG: hypothetical protein ACHQ49_07385 [Elusimicrobiota bacterium]
MAAGAALCLPDILMAARRDLARKNFPDVARSWDGNGRYIANALDGDTNLQPPRAAQAARTGWPWDPFVRGNHSLRLASRDGLTYAAMGLAIRCAGSVDRGWVLLRFICGAGWVLLVYALVAPLSRNRSWAVLCAMLLALFFDFPHNNPIDDGLLNWIRQGAVRLYWAAGPYAYWFGVSRIPNPGLTVMPFLGAVALLAAVLAAKTPRSRFATAVGAGLLTGALAYVHTDVWMVAMAGLALLTGCRLLGERRLPAGLFAACVCAGLVSLPWVLLNHGTDPEQMVRAEIVFGRTPSLTGLIFLAGAAAAWRFLPRDPVALVLESFLAAAGLAAQTQVLLGWNFSLLRWYHPGVVCLLVLGLAAVGRLLPSSRDWLWAAAVILSIAIARATSYAAQRYPYQALPARVDAGLTWLDKNAAPDSVVATLSPLETLLIPTYSSCKTLVPTAIILHSDLPVADIVRRLRRALQQYGIGEDAYLAAVDAHSYPDKKISDDIWRGHIDWEETDWIGTPFQGYPRKLSLEALRAQKGQPTGDANADYLWVGALERSLLSAVALKRLGYPLFQDGDVAIYRAPPAL